MKYNRIIRYVQGAVWAILPSKFEAITDVLSMRAAGGKITAGEIHAAIGERRPSTPSRGLIAVVPLHGTIAHRIGGMDEASGGVSAEAFTRVIQGLGQDESISTIVVDCASCGGTVTGVQQAAQAVFDAREHKRVVAIANGPMASACFWIASQAHERVAIPDVYDPVIGSIGVFMCHEDQSEMLAKEGRKITFISAGTHKLDGNPYSPLAGDVRDEMQASVNAAYDRFVKDVARGLGVAPAAVRSGYGEGRGLTSAGAKAAGLVDRIATMDETLDRLVGTKGRSQVGARAEKPNRFVVTEEYADDHVIDLTAAIAAAIASDPPDAEETIVAAAEPSVEDARIAQQAQADRDLTATALALAGSGL